MAILCLVLGVLSVVGSTSSQDPSTTSVMPSISPTTVPNQPTNAAAVSPTVSHSSTTATSIVSTLAKTDSLVTTPHTATIAGQSSTFTTTSNKAPTGASSSIASVPATSSLATVTKQSATSITVATTSQYNAITAGNSVTTQSDLPKQPEGTSATVTSQTSNAMKTSLKSTPSATVTETTKPILVSEAPKGTTIRIPGSSSASPPSKMTSPTTAGETQQIMTTKPTTAKLPSSSPSVPTTEAELTTHEDITSQKTIEINTVKKPTIEVRCTNLTNPTSYVKINMKGSAICDNDGQRTEGGHSTEDTISMLVCKALKPGYQENQDKCIIQLARINDNQLVITEAFIESHLQPKELYTQLKRNGENSHLFSYDGADPEDEDVVSIPLISAIVSLAVLLLIIAAAYGCWHQRKARKREQRLTEELQTMENGYHDNPTLEVMETSPEMQEKKGGPNGELGDSWIVPLDNLTREDLEDEEDTHL